MNYFVFMIFLIAHVGTSQASKTQVVIFNNSPESILVSIDDKLRKPLVKNSINVHEAKNFFLPALTPLRPYYLVIESSGESGRKVFFIGIDIKSKKIILSRNNYVLGTLNDEVLTDRNGQITISYYGSLKPEFPEIHFIQGDGTGNPCAISRASRCYKIQDRADRPVLFDGRCHREREHPQQPVEKCPGCRG